MGNVIDLRSLNIRTIVVKGVSVRLISLISHRDELTELCGDIGSAFILVNTTEKIYTRCGPEFGSREDSIALIVCALYGLFTSVEKFRTLLADSFKALGFTPIRYYCGIWMRLWTSADGYDYVCTHVDDFKIVAHFPEYWLNLIKKRSLVKQRGPPKYYVGNDYWFEEMEGLWTMGWSTYTKEAVYRIEKIRGGGSLQRIHTLTSGWLSSWAWPISVVGWTGTPILLNFAWYITMVQYNWTFSYLYCGQLVGTIWTVSTRGIYVIVFAYLRLFDFFPK